MSVPKDSKEYTKEIGDCIINAHLQAELAKLIETFGYQRIFHAMLHSVIEDVEELTRVSPVWRS